MKALAPHARLRAWGAGALIALATGFSPVALAQWDSNRSIVLSQVAGAEVKGAIGGSQLWKDVIGKTIEVNGGTGYVKLKQDISGPGPKYGSTLQVGVARGVGWGVITRTAAKALPLVGTALALKELMDTIRCREGTGGGGECDDGQNQTTVTVTYYQGCSGGAMASGSPPGTGWHSTLAGAIASRIACIQAGPLGSNRTYHAADISETSGSYSFRVDYNGVYLGSPFSGSDGYTGGSKAAGSGLQCPTVTIGGITSTPTLDADGKCKTGTYTPADEDEITTKGTNYGNKAKAALIAAELYNAGKPIPHDPPVYAPPESQPGGRLTVVNPDGSTTVRDKDWRIEPTADGYKWKERTIEQTYPPGATIPPEGSLPGAGGTTTEGAPDEKEITCGLPNTPPCKIDESGTPTAPADDSTTKVTGLMAGLLACIATPSACIPALPDMNWSFALPTGCAPIPLPGFGAWMESIDICPWQPTIHDIMSVVWAMAGLFGAVSIIFRGSE